jgi:hypothetical protein
MYFYDDRLISNLNFISKILEHINPNRFSVLL